MLRAALRSDNPDIQQSARNLNWFLWKTTDVEKDEGFKPTKDPKEDKLTQREQEFERKQLDTFTKDTQSVGLSKAHRLITKSLADFGLAPITEKHLTDEILKRTLEAMDKDVRYSGQMKQLWNKARTDGFVTEGKESIINAFLSRAKLTIPRIRQQVLAEAKVSAKQGSDDNKQNRKPTRLSGNNAAGKGAQPIGKVDPKAVDWNKTSERDLLDGKAPVMRK
jgi:hypothetical protein